MKGEYVRWWNRDGVGAGDRSGVELEEGVGREGGGG